MHSNRQTHTRIFNCVHACLYLPVSVVGVNMHARMRPEAVAMQCMQQGITARLKAESVDKLVCRARHVPS